MLFLHERDAPMSNTPAAPVSSKRPSRNDKAAKVDKEVLRIATSVAALRGISVAEYISEILRPIVTRDHIDECRRAHVDGSGPSAPSSEKAKGKAKPVE